jgi:hypothetical protein
MSISRDLNDTANLRESADPTITSRLATSGNTGTLRDSNGDARDRVGLSGTTAHPYAEGIIRFYRARTILDNDRPDRCWSRAWRYLNRLGPRDLPSSARREFLELVYFMQEQAGRADFAAEDFCGSIRSIAQLIDTYVDELNQRCEG